MLRSIPNASHPTTHTMRSLAFKLTLSFLLVGVIGVAVFGVLVARRTQNEFNQFLSARDQSILVNALTEYYKSNHGWENVTTTLLKGPPLNYYSRSTTLVDGDGKIIYQNFPIHPETNQRETDDQNQKEVSLVDVDMQIVCHSVSPSISQSVCLTAIVPACKSQVLTKPHHSHTLLPYSTPLTSSLFRSPAIIRMKVVLPVPFSPNITTISESVNAPPYV